MAVNRFDTLNGGINNVVATKLLIRPSASPPNPTKKKVKRMLSKVDVTKGEKVSECCGAKVSGDTAFHAKGWICTFCGDPCEIADNSKEYVSDCCHAKTFIGSWIGMTCSKCGEPCKRIPLSEQTPTHKK